MVKNEVKVFARLKPEENRRKVVSYQIHKRPKKHRDEDFLVLNAPIKLLNDYINNRPESWTYSFCKVFDEDSKQEDVFENVAQPVIQSVLNGYNGTIFAYGQTGSGKTHTITGDQKKNEDRGILPRTVRYLFDTIRKNPDNLYSIEVAYLEIYNENGYDLLDPRHSVAARLEDLPRVTIQEDKEGGLHLKNLSFHNVDSERNAMDLLFLGDTNRVVSETPMNPNSSRSHCIFTIVVSVKLFGAAHHSRAKMHLVDLAGSERVYKCAITGIILTEAKHINLSLHYLEQVIVCLGQEGMIHIPYRNSLLTAILRDSLGGNCLTTMLATISIAAVNLQETVSTCRFAQRVALVRNDVNLVFEKSPENEIAFLKMEVDRLKCRILQLTNHHPTEDLTKNEMQQLDSQVEEFLKSNSTMDCDNDPRKIQYCMQQLRGNYEATADAKSCTGQCWKKLEYYKNMVYQRDEEISLLINMLKKETTNDSKSASDVEGTNKNFERIFCDNGDNLHFPAMLENNRKSRKISPSAFVRDKKHCLRKIVDEAKPIAECVRSGNMAIAELRTMLNKTDSSHPDVHKLQQTLKVEQAKLAENLSSLRSLKSKAASLKAAISIEKSNLSPDKIPIISDSFDSHSNSTKTHDQPTANRKNTSKESENACDNNNSEGSGGKNVSFMTKDQKKEFISKVKSFVQRNNVDLKVPSINVVEDDTSDGEAILEETGYHKSIWKGVEDDKITGTVHNGNEDSHKNVSKIRTEQATTTHEFPGLHFTRNVEIKMRANENSELDKSSPKTVETETQVSSTKSPDKANSVKVENHKCGFRTPRILRNILCFDRDSSKKVSAVKNSSYSPFDRKSSSMSKDERRTITENLPSSQDCFTSTKEDCRAATNSMRKVAENDFDSHEIFNNGNTDVVKNCHEASFSNPAEESLMFQDNVKQKVNDLTRIGCTSEDVVSKMSLRDSCQSKLKNPNVILKNFQETSFSGDAGQSAGSQDNLKQEVTDLTRTRYPSEDVETFISINAVQSPGSQDILKQEVTDFKGTGYPSKDVETPFSNDAEQSSGSHDNDKPIVTNFTITDDENFVKSLPLTGDPEIDEEIIAFYKAKCLGGTY